LNPAGNLHALGTVTAVAVPSGGRTFPRGQSTVDPAAEWSSLSISEREMIAPFTPTDTFSEGEMRVVGIGVEIIDANATLYQQGTAMCYATNRFNTMSSSMTVDAFDPAGDTYRQCDAYASRGPPGSLQEAALLPDTRQWHAREGAYLVARMQGSENEFRRPLPIQPYILGKELQSTFKGPTDTSWHVVPLGNNLDTSQEPSANDGNPIPRTFHQFDQCGVYFAGLSGSALNPSGAMVVNVRFIIERAPTAEETDLITLARPSPEADPTAFALYSEAVRLAPPGVMLKENATGQWFRDAVRNVTEELGTAAPHLLEGFIRGGPQGAITAGLEYGLNNAGRISKNLTKSNSTKAERRAVQATQDLAKNARTRPRRQRRQRRKEKRIDKRIKRLNARR